MLPPRQINRGNPPSGNGGRVVLFSPARMLLASLGVTILLAVFFIGYIIGQGQSEQTTSSGIALERVTTHEIPSGTPSGQHSVPEPARAIPAQSFTTPIPSSPPVNDYEKAVFDSVPDEGFARLTPEQQWAFAKAEEDFDAYYQETVRQGASKPEDWNAVMAEFHRDLVLRLGGETVDQLLKPASSAVNP